MCFLEFSAGREDEESWSECEFQRRPGLFFIYLWAIHIRIGFWRVCLLIVDNTFVRFYKRILLFIKEDSLEIAK